METLDSLLGPEETLSRVTWFEVHRLKNESEGERVPICVHEFLNGTSKGTFCAIPTYSITETKDEYVGTGDSLDAALNDCLAKIKGVDIDDMIEK